MAQKITPRTFAALQAIALGRSVRSAAGVNGKTIQAIEDNEFVTQCGVTGVYTLTDKGRAAMAAHQS